MAPSRSPLRVLVTAGPTREPIDAVRFIGNRSSGRMGLAIAVAAARAGHATTLLLGPASLEPPADAAFVTLRFRTTADLAGLLGRTWPEHDVLIMAAAVADFRPVDASPDEKLRRSGGRLTLELEATPDLLADLAATTRPDQRVIGFALEHEDDLERAARAKLERKKLDAIVGNPLETMDARHVEPILVVRDGRTLRPTPARLPKEEFAEWLVGRLEDLEARRPEGPEG